MSLGLGEAVLILRATGDRLSRDIDGAERSVSGRMKSMGAGMAKVGAGMSLAVSGPLIAIGAGAVKALMGIETLNAQTGATLKSTGGAAGVTLGSILKLADGIEKMTGIEAEAVQAGQNMLLTFTGIKAEHGIFDRATAATADLATAMNGGVLPSMEQMKSTSVLLGKALNDPAKGAAALKKQGSLAAADIDKLNQMGKDGVPVWKQQQYILKALEKQYGGSAKAAGGTLAGGIAKVKNAFGEFSESIVSGLMPHLQGFADRLVKLGAAFNGLSPQTRKWVAIGAAMAVVIGPILLGVGALLMVLPALGAVLGAISLPVVAVVAAIALLGVALIKLWRTNEGFRDAVKKIWAQVRKAISATLLEVRKTATVWAAWFRSFWSAHGAQITSTAKKIWAGIYQIIGGYIKVVRGVVKTVMSLLRGDWRGAWDGIKMILSGAWTMIKTYVRAGGTAIVAALSAAWRLAKSGASRAWEGISTAISDAVTALPGKIIALLGGLVSDMADLGERAGAALANAIRDAINAVLDGIRSFELPSVKVGKRSIGGGTPFASIPALAAGGVVTDPTLALIGEGRGRGEAVIPLEKLDAMLSGGGGAGVEQHFHVSNPVEQMGAFMRRARIEARWAGAR